MGKIRTRVIGIEEVEKKQKENQKKRSQEKKSLTKKIRAPGLKGGERMKQMEVDAESLAKMEKAKKLIETKPTTPAVRSESKKAKVKVHHHGFKYQKASKMINPQKTYGLTEAIVMLKKMKLASFDESVEIHLNVDKTGLKGEVELPHATGKSIRIKIADETVLADIEKGKLEFDMLVTHPSFMPKLAKFAKILGPKGLMPNPKAGTISPHPEEVAKKFAKGGLRWKTEAKFPLIHQMIGKISFDEKKLEENAEVFLRSVGTNHIQSAYLKTTMSPSVRIEVAALS